MTVAQLAEASSLSRQMLTRIELGKANPSLRTVDRIANSLGTNLPGLIRDADAQGVEVVRAGHARRVWSDEVGGEALIHVASAPDNDPALWTWTLAPHSRYDAQPDPPGSSELFLVMQGQLTIDTLGGAATLDVGDAARIATDQDYAYRNDGDDPCRFVRVVHVPLKKTDR